MSALSIASNNREGDHNLNPVSGWDQIRRRRFRVLLTKDEDGIITSSVLKLPGIVSEGETEAEALSNIKDAIISALDVYGDNIPWEKVEEEIPLGSKVLLVQIDV